MSNPNKLEQIEKLYERGFSLIPLKPKSKLPNEGWKAYQDKRASQEDIRTWFGQWGVDRNVGIVTGAISWPCGLRH